MTVRDLNAIAIILDFVANAVFGCAVAVVVIAISVPEGFIADSIDLRCSEHYTCSSQSDSKSEC